jgi:hypothetical protein
MNWDALGAIAELLGAIAVFLTLAYLAIQVRQNSRALEEQNKFSAAQIMQARTDTAISFLSTMMGSAESIKATIELQQLTENDSLESFTKEERDRMTLILQMQRGMFENLYDQNKRGLLTQGYYDGAPSKNLKTVAPALFAFEIPMSEEFQAEVRRVGAPP